jgi:hypothetical protein
VIGPAIVAAVLSFMPGATGSEKARLETFAAGLTEAAETSAHPLTGPASPAAAGLMLVAIAWHESAFRAEVLDCRVRGSRGDATAWQLLGPWARTDTSGKRWSILDVCASVPLAAELALHVLSRFAAVCRSPIGWLRGYASGRCGAPPKGKPDPGLVRCLTWERLASRAGLIGASCYRRGPIRLPYPRGHLTAAEDAADFGPPVPRTGRRMPSSRPPRCGGARDRRPGHDRDAARVAGFCGPLPQLARARRVITVG